MSGSTRGEFPGPLADRLQGLLDSLVARQSIRHAIIAMEGGDGSLRLAAAAGARLVLCRSAWSPSCSAPLPAP